MNLEVLEAVTKFSYGSLVGKYFNSPKKNLRFVLLLFGFLEILFFFLSFESFREQSVFVTLSSQL